MSDPLAMPIEELIDAHDALLRAYRNPRSTGLEMRVALERYYLALSTWKEQTTTPASADSYRGVTILIETIKREMRLLQTDLLETNREIRLLQDELAALKEGIAACHGHGEVEREREVNGLGSEGAGDDQ